MSEVMLSQPVAAGVLEEIGEAVREPRRNCLVHVFVVGSVPEREEQPLLAAEFMLAVTHPMDQGVVNLTPHWHIAVHNLSVPLF